MNKTGILILLLVLVVILAAGSMFTVAAVSYTHLEVYKRQL